MRIFLFIFFATLLSGVLSVVAGGAHIQLDPMVALWVGLAILFAAGVVTGVTGAWLVICDPLRQWQERFHAE